MFKFNFKSKPAAVGPDTPPVPKDLLQAQATLQSLVAQSRAQLVKTQNSTQQRIPMDRTVIASLYRTAVAAPSVTQTATLLARLSPAALLGLTGESQVESDEASERKFTLYAALLEAGLSEQILPDGTVASGGPLSAVALEASLDDWMIRGRHRPGFDAGELAKIDTFVSRTAKGALSSLELLHTRFGVLMPCLANVHVWRMLEEMPAAKSAKLGWRLLEADESADVNANDDRESDSAVAMPASGDQGLQHG